MTQISQIRKVIRRCRRLSADDRLRTAKATRELPIMFLGSLEDVKDKARGFEVGANDYLTWFPSTKTRRTWRPTRIPAQAPGRNGRCSTNSWLETTNTVYRLTKVPGAKVTVEG